MSRGLEPDPVMVTSRGREVSSLLLQITDATHD